MDIYLKRLKLWGIGLSLKQEEGQMFKRKQTQQTLFLCHSFSIALFHNSVGFVECWIYNTQSFGAENVHASTLTPDADRGQLFRERKREE